MTTRHLHDDADPTAEAVAALRRLLREHERSGARERPLHRGIRVALADLERYAETGESSAA